MQSGTQSKGGRNRRMPSECPLVTAVWRPGCRAAGVQAFSSYLRARDTVVQRRGFLKATGRALSVSDHGSPLHHTAASWRAQVRIINIWSLWPELTLPPKTILTLRLRDKNICRYPFLPPAQNGRHIKRSQWSTCLEPWKHPERKLWGPRENTWPRGRIPVSKL